MQRTEAAAGDTHSDGRIMASQHSQAVKLTREDKLRSVLKVIGGFEGARKEEEQPAW